MSGSLADLNLGAELDVVDRSWGRRPSAVEVVHTNLRSMEESWRDWLLLAVSSGLAAGLANQLFRFVHDALAEGRQKKSQRLELKHQEDMLRRQSEGQRELQLEEREHQRRLRREEAFFHARTRFAPAVTGVQEWITWWWADLYRDEVDYHPVNLHPPATIVSPADAIRSLSQLAGEHPWKSVRARAERLRLDIDNACNRDDLTEQGEPRPTVDQLSNWERQAGALLDALHEPDAEVHAGS